MHRTLKLEAAQATGGEPAQTNSRRWTFREEYNRVRPHEAHADATPAAVYQPSPRTFPVQAPEPEYRKRWLVRSVRRKGHFR